MFHSLDQTETASRTVLTTLAQTYRFKLLGKIVSPYVIISQLKASQSIISLTSFPIFYYNNYSLIPLIFGFN